jgi:transcriptional regulator with XRE-family HTH domain
MSVVTYFCNQYAFSVKHHSIEAVYKELGKRVVAARKAKNMSQEQLATNSGIDRSHMGFIEQGRRKPTLSTLFKIANTLNLTLEQLFRDL